MIGLIYPPVPSKKKVKGHRGFMAIFAGLFWFWISSNHMYMFPNPELFISEIGILPINNSGKKGWNIIAGLARQMIKYEV